LLLTLLQSSRYSIHCGLLLNLQYLILSHPLFNLLHHPVTRFIPAIPPLNSPYIATRFIIFQVVSLLNLLHHHVMGWLRLVGSIKLQVSFAEYSFFYRALLQKRPGVLRSLQVVATPYSIYSSHPVTQSITYCYSIYYITSLAAQFTTLSRCMYPIYYIISRHVLNLLHHLATHFSSSRYSIYHMSSLTLLYLKSSRCSLAILVYYVGSLPHLT